VITTAEDLTSRTVGRFLGHGIVLMETDGQHCCRWVAPAAAAVADAPGAVGRPASRTHLIPYRKAFLIPDHQLPVTAVRVTVESSRRFIDTVME
jgi:hypothetical protein